jgi:hypothetical protein
MSIQKVCLFGPHFSPTTRPIVCSASSSDASIELRWADLTLFTPFLHHFVSVVSTPAEPVQASLLEPGTHSLEVLDRRREARRAGGAGQKG